MLMTDKPYLPTAPLDVVVRSFIQGTKASACLFSLGTLGLTCSQGWPGGVPLSDMNKRQPEERDRLSEWPRLRASKPPERSNSQSVC